MGYDDGSRVGENGSLHHLPRMHDAGVQAADMANVDGSRLVFRVKADNDKLLTVGFHKKRLQQLVRIFWRFDLTLLVQHARFTNELQTYNIDALRWLFGRYLSFQQL